MTLYQTNTQEQSKIVQSKITHAYSFRVEALKKLRDTLKLYEPSIKEALFFDLGKSGTESFMSEIGLIYQELNYHIKNLKHFMKIRQVKTPFFQLFSKSYVIPEPLGRILIISPWNYPFLLSFMPLIGAIAAGNVTVVKPSEYAKASSLLIEKIVSEAFDKAYITVFLADASGTDLLLEEPFDHIFFTGSARVGKLIMAKASKRLTPVTLELGGKSPAVIDRGFPLSKAAKRIAFGKMMNAGQTCVAPDYVWIHREDVDAFSKYYQESIRTFFGENPLESEGYPKMIHEEQLNRMLNLIKDKTLVFGGQHQGLKMEPTLLEMNDRSDPLMTEEIFGPILPMVTYDDISEVYECMNQMDKPLASYLFTKNKKVERSFITKTSSGAVVINDTLMHLSNIHLPFGGIGQSGMGSYRGYYSFQTFSHFKSVLKSSMAFEVKARYHPYKPYQEKMMRMLIK